MGICDDNGLEGRAFRKARSCAQVCDICDIQDDIWDDPRV